MRALLASIFFGAALGGCVLPPQETSHPAMLAAERVGLDGAASQPLTADWWHSFGDPQLDEFIRLGLINSPTLAQGQARVEEALAQGESARAGLLPNASLDASALYQRAPAEYLIPPPLAGHTFWMAQGGASLGWDLDFWGRQADAVHRAQALARSAQLNMDDARLMISGAIVQAYIELFREQALADIAERSAAQRQHIIDITRRRVGAGLDTRLELRQAEGQLPQARVARSQATAAAELAVHQLAALSGQGAASYATVNHPLLNIDAAVPIPTALPINLLARRPDVLSARLTVEAADFERMAAKATFYPDVNLRALVGLGAFGLSNLLQGSARGYGAGPLISLPLFDGGKLRAAYKSSEAQLDSAIAAYDEIVLRAVRQSADQLTRIDALARQRVDQQQTLDATEAAYSLAEKRYRAGLASYLSVLNAETQVLSARQAMLDIQANLALSRVMLLLAVGGSFDAATAAPSSASTAIPTGTLP